jgi:hypothetical protein
LTLFGKTDFFNTHRDYHHLSHNETKSAFSLTSA